MKPVVRRLGEGDLAGFRAMNSVFADGFGEDGEHYRVAPVDDENALRWLANASHVGLIAEADGKPVGALAGYIFDKYEQSRRELFIYDLAVLESHRRQGIASALLEETRRIARAAACWTIVVQADVFPEDEPARALYRKFACEEITAHHFDIAP